MSGQALGKILAEIESHILDKTEKLRDDLANNPHQIDLSAQRVAEEMSLQMSYYDKGKPKTIKAETEADFRARVTEARTLNRFKQADQNIINYTANMYIKTALESIRGKVGLGKKGTTDWVVDPMSALSLINSFQELSIKEISTATNIPLLPAVSIRISLADPEKGGSKGLFGQISNILAGAKNVAVSWLKNQKSFKDVGAYINPFFHLGHITAVSTIRVESTAAFIKTRIGGLDSSLRAEAEKIINLSAFSKFYNYGGTVNSSSLAEILKEIVIKAEPQSEKFNINQSKYERAIVGEARAAFTELINSRDWSIQDASDNMMTAITKVLAGTAKSVGAKVDIDTRPDANPSRATKRLKIKPVKNKLVKVPGPSFRTGVTLPSQGQLRPSGVNLRSLIPSLNQRLPEFVRDNMGQNGRLTNRTSRFSESAQIVDIDENSFITYTYMKNPYQVFEKDKQKDPRPLIEQSIREMVIGQIGARFGVRRI